jgi:hypothetical protein
MKSSMEIAKDIGVSPQEIHKRLSPEFMRQFKDNCIEEKDGCMYFDSEVEDLLKLLFNKKQEDITTNWFYNDEDIALQKNAAENNLPIKNPESTSEAIEPKAYDDSQLDEIPYINNKALDELKEHGKELNLHFVITHTCPSFAPPTNRNGIQHFIVKDEDLVDDLKYERSIMDNIYKRLSDDYHIILEWHYGHFHWSNNEVIKGIRFRLHKDTGYEVDMTDIETKIAPIFKEEIL